jgi:hypothetical protein
MTHSDTEDTKPYSEETLRAILVNTMNGYAGEGFNGFSYLTSNDNQEIFTVISIAQVHGKRFADTGLIVRFHNNKIIIERDVNDKILADALIQAGVPREQIILAYAGETVEETV